MSDDDYAVIEDESGRVTLVRECHQKTSFLKRYLLPLLAVPPDAGAYLLFTSQLMFVLSRQVGLPIASLVTGLIIGVLGSLNQAPSSLHQYL